MASVFNVGLAVIRWGVDSILGPPEFKVKTVCKRIIKEINEFNRDLKYSIDNFEHRKTTWKSLGYKETATISTPIVYKKYIFALEKEVESLSFIDLSSPKALKGLRDVDVFSDLFFTMSIIKTMKEYLNVQLKNTNDPMNIGKEITLTLKSLDRMYNKLSAIHGSIQKYLESND